jgi:hypothetical protein
LPVPDGESSHPPLVLYVAKLGVIVLGLLSISDVQLHYKSENGKSARQAAKSYTKKLVKWF